MENQEKSETKVKKGRIGSFFRFTFKVISILLAFILGVSLVASIFIFIKLKPMYDEAKMQAFLKESSISDKTFRREGATIIYDKDGNQIGVVANTNYKYVSLGDVSEHVINGFIAVEDQEFLTNIGVDFKRTAKAAYLYLKNKGKITMGGSTITQQLVKNTLLTQEQTVERKMTEILIALELTKRYTKSQIMEFYVNNIYFGNGNTGIESASQFYFSRSASSLTLAESALLCGVTNNPTMYDPITKPDKAKERRNTVLWVMLEQGYITQEEYNQAKNEEIVLNISKPKSTPENYMISLAIDNTVKVLMRNSGFQFKYWFDTVEDWEDYQNHYKQVYAETDKEVRTGGYKIYTSLDPEKQRMLQSILDSKLASFTEIDPATKKPAFQGASVSIDNQTGKVVAIVGGRGDTDIFNRGFLAVRQPGSTIKPLVAYAPAFDQGYNPLYKIKDQKVEDGPDNYQKRFFGDVTLRYATEVSLNTVPYQLLRDIKPSTGLKYLTDLGFSSLHPYDNNPIISIGGFTYGVTPLELAGGYYALANGGYYVQPDCLLKVVHWDNTLYDYEEQEGKQVYTKESAYIMTDILKGVIEQPHGTGYSLRLDGHVVTGKTGTTEGNKDAWFVGYSAYYTTVVWVGYDIPRPVEGLYGSTYPGQIWLEYMKEVHKDLPKKDFHRPSTIVMRNIDNMGKPTDKNTGIQDMFAQTIDPELEEQKRIERMRLLSEMQANREELELKREQTAKSLVSAYESQTYTTVSELDKVDKAYQDALSVVNALNNQDLKRELLERIDFHKESIAKDRQLVVSARDREIQAELEKERIKKEQEAKLQLDAKIKAEEEAREKIIKQQEQELQSQLAVESILQELESLPEGYNFFMVEHKYNEARQLLTKVTDKVKYNEYQNRLIDIRHKFD